MYSAHPVSAQPSLHGRYQLHTRLSHIPGRPVWAAFDRLLEREVVIKGVESSQGVEAVAGLAQEYLRLLVRRHPFLPEVYDCSVAPHPEQPLMPLHYFVQERLTGPTLDQLRGTLSWDALEQLARQLLEGVAWLHASGLSRLDLKPAHLFLTQDRWRLIDLDQAEQDDPSFRDPHGTPGYLAPEQTTGASLGAQTDLYTVGVVLLESLPASREVDAPSSALHASERSKLSSLPRGLLKQAPRLWRLLQALLQPDAAERPTGAEQALTLLLAPEQLSFAQACPPYTAWRAAAPLPPFELLARARAREGLMVRLEQARLQRGGVIQLTGPTGMGFTRFLQESLLPLQHEGVMVLWLDRLLATPKESSPTLPETEPAGLRALVRALRWLVGELFDAPPWPDDSLLPQTPSVGRALLQSPERSTAVEPSSLHDLLKLSRRLVQLSWPVLVVMDSTPVLDDATRQTFRALGPYLEQQQLILLTVQETPEASLREEGSRDASSTGEGLHEPSLPDDSPFELSVALTPLAADEVRRWVEQRLSERFITGPEHLAKLMQVTRGRPAWVAARLQRHWQQGHGLELEALTQLEQSSMAASSPVALPPTLSLRPGAATEQISALMRAFKFLQVVQLLEPLIKQESEPLTLERIQLRAHYAFALQQVGRRPESVVSFDWVLAQAERFDPTQQVISFEERVRWQLRACWSLLEHQDRAPVGPRLRRLAEQGPPPTPSLEIERDWIQLRLIYDENPQADVQAALQSLLERVQRDGTPTQTIRLENFQARLAMNRRDYAKALEVLDRLMVRHREAFQFPQEAITLRNKAAVLDALGRLGEAQQLLERGCLLHAYAGNEASAFSNACDSLFIFFQMGALERARQRLIQLERSPWRRAARPTDLHRLKLLVQMRILRDTLERESGPPLPASKQEVLKGVQTALEQLGALPELRSQQALRLVILSEQATVALWLGSPSKVLALLEPELHGLETLPSLWLRDRLKQLFRQALERVANLLEPGVVQTGAASTPARAEFIPSKASSTSLKDAALPLRAVPAPSSAAPMPSKGEPPILPERKLLPTQGRSEGGEARSPVLVESTPQLIPQLTPQLTLPVTPQLTSPVTPLVGVGLGQQPSSVRPPLGSLRPARAMEAPPEDVMAEESLLWLERLPRMLKVAEEPDALAAELAELAGALLQGDGLMYVLDAEGPQILKQTPPTVEPPAELLPRVLEWVEREQKPLYINELSREGKRLQLRESWHKPPQSVAALPIMDEKTLVAVLYVQRAQPGVFREARARTILEALARAARSSLAHRQKQRQWSRREPSELGLIGNSRPVQTLRSRIRDVLAQKSDDVVIFLDGEIGVGKSLVARMIHKYGARKERPFLPVNCGAVPEGLFESLMCGHLRGTFTGASHDRAGWLEQARGGVLFLDEVAEMPVAQQAKLLTILGDRSFSRVGDIRTIPLDVHLISATNRSLKEILSTNNLRSDFIRRLHVNVIEVPSLRARGPEDIHLLAGTFIHQYLYGREGAAQRSAPSLEQYMSSAAIDLLYQYDWPWNVAELENLFRDARVRLHLETQGENKIPRELVQQILAANVALGARRRVGDTTEEPGSPVSSPNSTSPHLSSPNSSREEVAPEGFTFKPLDTAFTLDELNAHLEAEKKRCLQKLLNACEGNISRAAAELECSRDVFYRALDPEHPQKQRSKRPKKPTS